MMWKFVISTIFALLVMPFTRAESGLPKDVRNFIMKREACEHFRGEVPEPSEKRRMQEVAREINARCRGTDHALAALKEKYANDVEVIARLNAYEDLIEAHPERLRAK